MALHVDINRVNNTTSNRQVPRLEFTGLEWQIQMV